MKTLSLHPVSLLLGAAFTLTLALTLGAQGPMLKPGPELRRPAAFAPHPEDVWNYTTANEPDANSSGNISVPSSSFLRVLFSVPDDRWLVVSGGRVTGGAAVDLVEASASGTTTVKLGSRDFGGVTGLFNVGTGGFTFSPGSDVALERQFTSGASTVGLTLAGYFVDAQ